MKGGVHTLAHRWNTLKLAQGKGQRCSKLRRMRCMHVNRGGKGSGKLSGEEGEVECKYQVEAVCTDRVTRWQ